MSAHPKCRTVGCHQPIKVNSPHCKLHSSKKRCPNCVDWIDSRYGQKQYDGYCATCFKHIFPNDPRVKQMRIGKYELQVRNFINQHFTGFIHDTNIYTYACDCTNRRRIDHFKLLGNTVLAIETDEHQHQNYADEEIRYNDLYMHFSGKWIFIRFNVHSYYDHKNKFRLTTLRARLDRLKDEIQRQIDRIHSESNTEPLEVVRLFYDGVQFPQYDYLWDGVRFVKTLRTDH